jgi:hypothetical protein
MYLILQLVLLYIYIYIYIYDTRPQLYDTYVGINKQVYMTSIICIFNFICINILVCMTYMCYLMHAASRNNS